ncbi:transposase [Aquimarina algicola]|uniref:Transposase n=1 Tax=Aquimarina algicola TaxID=2589995 RepID=A0A504JLZ6_9FLAO|nr:transposase [Aquimarina algicola]TPN87819.1 transposase [Aquimarina algicola]
MKYELLTPGSYFHVYNRGNNRENLFKEDRNYNYFLSLLAKHVHPVCKIYAYCLLKNHFHLIAKTRTGIEEKQTSQKFSNMFNAYAKAMNKSYNRTGSLFENRFSRKKIDSEKYLKQLIIYIHRNPEHHNFTRDFRTYPYSSYHSHLSQKPSKIEREFVLSLFEGKSNFEYTHINKKL